MPARDWRWLRIRPARANERLEPAQGKGPAETAPEAAFQRALKALQSVSAAYGSPADDPRHIDFVAFGGEPAKNALHDGVLKELIGLPHLSRLRVNWSGVTDAGLKHIAKMPSLTELELESAPITDAGIRELKSMSAKSPTPA